MRVLTVLCLLAAACFSPDEKDGTVHCAPAPDPDPCPPDFVCAADNFCRRPGSPAPDATPPKPDAMPGKPDGGPKDKPDGGKHMGPP